MHTFAGGSGNDTYYVDSVKGRVVEAAGKAGGNDHIITTVSYWLAPDSAIELVTIGATASWNAISFVGNKYKQTITGGAGKNAFDGRGGDDALYGKGGNDLLTGGSGADALWGGAGKDAFIFKALAHSTAKRSGQDTIYDFGKGDRFDLSALDASSKKVGNQAFSFVGTDKFDGKAGELRYEKKSSDTYVYADTNGDKKVDFAFHLDDAVKLVKADFLL